MAQWASIDDIIAAMVNATTPMRSFMYPSVAATSGIWQNLAQAAGRYGAMATPPAASAGGGVPVDSDSGFIPFTNASGSNELRLLLWALGPASVTHGYAVFDRLWACSGFSGTVLTAQATTSPVAITRPDANGTGAEIFAEIYTLIGTTAATLSVSYTNSAGVAGRTATATIGGSGRREVGRMIPMQLQSGDTGVKSIESVTLSGTTGTAGDFGITIARRVAFSGQGALSRTLSWADLGMPKIEPDAALMMAVYPSGTVAAIEGILLIGEH